MSYPTTDRLKSLIERVAEQGDQVYAGHHYRPGQYPGLVVGYYTPGSSSSSSSGSTTQPTALLVIPLPVTGVSDSGDITVNTGVPADLTKVLSIRVCPLGIAASSIRATYTTGTVIAYWPMSAAGDLGKKVRSTYVTVTPPSYGHGIKYQQLTTLDDAGTVGWDWPRFH